MRIINRIIIEEKKKLENDNYLLIQGLPGIGLVGLTAAEFFLDEYDNELVYTFIPYDARPIAMAQGKTYMAEVFDEIRVYEINELNRPLLVLTGRRQPEISIYDTFNAILDVLGEKVSDLVAIGGMTGSANEIGSFTFTEDVSKRLEEKEVPPLEISGYMNITGAVAMFPKLASLRGIRAWGLLSKVRESSIEEIPLEHATPLDPLASKRAVELLNKVYDLGITDEKLAYFDRKAEDVKKIEEEIMKKLLAHSSEHIGDKAMESIHEGEEDKYYV